MAFLQSKPEGLEPQMWSKPNKQGELKKQGTRLAPSGVPFPALTRVPRPFREELEDALVHLAAG